MTQHDDGEQDVLPADNDIEGEDVGFDWPVFLARAAGLFVIGAMLVTAIDASVNSRLGWVDVMRSSILPFAAGALLMVGGELMDRLGE